MKHSVFFTLDVQAANETCFFSADSRAKNVSLICFICLNVSVYGNLFVSLDDWRHVCCQVQPERDSDYKEKVAKSKSDEEEDAKGKNGQIKTKHVRQMKICTMLLVDENFVIYE